MLLISAERAWDIHTAAFLSKPIPLCPTVQLSPHTILCTKWCQAGVQLAGQKGERRKCGEVASKEIE